jgi:hypothetical protein
MHFAPRGFPRPPYLPVSIDSGGNEVVVKGQHDRQEFQLSARELIEAVGEHAILQNIQARETPVEAEVKDAFLEFMDIFKVQRLRNNSPPRPQFNFRMAGFERVAEALAEYTKQDPVFVATLNRVLSLTDHQAMRLEGWKDTVGQCFAAYDDLRTSYDQRQCKRSLERCASKISQICVRAAGQAQVVDSNVRASAACTLIFMLKGICHRFALYDEIMSDQPEELWEPVLKSLAIIGGLALLPDQADEFDEIYALVQREPPLKNHLLDRFGALLS